MIIEDSPFYKLLTSSCDNITPSKQLKYSKHMFTIYNEILNKNLYLYYPYPWDHPSFIQLFENLIYHRIWPYSLDEKLVLHQVERLLAQVILLDNKSLSTKAKLFKALLPFILNIPPDSTKEIFEHSYTIVITISTTDFDNHLELHERILYILLILDLLLLYNVKKLSSKYTTYINNLLNYLDNLKEINIYIDTDYYKLLVTMSKIPTLELPPTQLESLVRKSLSLFSNTNNNTNTNTKQILNQQNQITVLSLLTECNF